MSDCPNILIFMTDQQRWDVTEPGNPCKTPNLDRMAREGIRFRNVYPPMAHCFPARASFMTGLSLQPFFSGRAIPTWRDALYMPCNGTEVFFSSRTVRTDRWKFVYNAVAFDELYDLENDPFERVNLVEDPAHSDIKKDLYARMWQLALEAGDSYLSCEYHTVSLADWGPMTGLASNH